MRIALFRATFKGLEGQQVENLVLCLRVVIKVHVIEISREPVARIRPEDPAERRRVSRPCDSYIGKVSFVGYTINIERDLAIVVDPGDVVPGVIEDHGRRIDMAGGRRPDVSIQRAVGCPVVRTQVEERGAVRRRSLREDPEIALPDRTPNPHRDAENGPSVQRQTRGLRQAYARSVRRVEVKRAALCPVVTFDEGQRRAADNCAVVAAVP